MYEVIYWLVQTAGFLDCRFAFTGFSLHHGTHTKEKEKRCVP